MSAFCYILWCDRPTFQWVTNPTYQHNRSHFRSPKMVGAPRNTTTSCFYLLTVNWAYFAPFLLNRFRGLLVVSYLYTPCAHVSSHTFRPLSRCRALFGSPHWAAGSLHKWWLGPPSPCLSSCPSTCLAFPSRYYMSRAPGTVHSGQLSRWHGSAVEEGHCPASC